MSIGERRLSMPECVDEGLVIVPFSFITRATAAPDTVKGDEILVVAGARLVTRTSAGLFTFTLFDKAFDVVSAWVNSTSGATEDIVPHIDASSVTTNGVVTVRTMTGATATDPATGCTVYGGLIVKKTDRKDSL